MREVKDISDSSMVRRQGRVMRWLGRTFFGAVRFEEGGIEAIREACSAGTPVYVINAHSRLDYLYFNYAFLRFGLPLVYFANEISMLLFRPVGQVARRCRDVLCGRTGPGRTDREMMKAGLQSGKPCLIFLKRPRALTQWGAEFRISYLRDVLEIQEELEKTIVLVPLLLVWEQQPESYRRSMFDVVFGDPQAPGAIRKMLSFFRNFRRARAQVGKPINVRHFVHDNQDAGSPDVMAARLKYAISEEFLRESRAIRGPVMKGRRTMVDEIMRTRPFLDAVGESGQKAGLSRAASERKAAAWLKNMAADFRLGWMEAFGLVLGIIFQRRFTGIAVDTAGLERIREVGRAAPVVLIPSRRSILDYFVHSFVFYTHGLIPPHVAVREQKKLNPFKWALRRTGAFFVRPRIAGNAMYEQTLYQYVRKLIKEGYWLEFFIEGSRSRSGKLQQPREELLTMVLASVATGAAPDAWLVPSSVTYERIVESRHFAKERRGGDGRAVERVSLQNILKRARSIGGRFGRLYMNFREPVSVREYLAGQGVSLPLKEGETIDPMLVRRLGYLLMSDINRALVVTPQNLVAFVLMTNRGRGIPREELDARVRDLVSRISERGGILSDPLKAAMSGRSSSGAWHEVCLESGESGSFVQTDPGRPARQVTPMDALLEEVLGILSRENAISITGEGFDSVVTVVERNRVWLEYYKNAIIHFFLPEAVLATAATCLADMDPIPEDRLDATAKELLRIFRCEFVYDRWSSSESQQTRTLEKFLDEGIFVREGGGIRNPRDRQADLEWYAGILRPFVDSYRVLATVVARSPQRQDRDVIIADAMKTGRKAWLIGDVERAESVSPVIFKNALKLLRAEVERGWAQDIRTAAEQVIAELPKPR